MSTEIQPFIFPSDTDIGVRGLTIGEEPWFIAADVATALGYRMASDMTRRLDEDDKGTRSVRTPGGQQEMVIISEAGLYVAILGSQIPSAKAFKRWVTHDVLPALRRTGSYSVQQLSPRELAQLVITEADRADRAEQHVAELEPAAQAWDTLSNANGDYSLREAAQILSRDPGVATIGQNRLLKYLREIRWVDFHSTPYQDQVDIGRLVRRTDTYDHPHTGEAKLYTQVRITPKGLAELRNRLRAAAQPMLTGASR